MSNHVCIDPRDIPLLYAAVEIVLHSRLPRSERQTFLKVRDRLRPLYRKAMDMQNERRNIRERTTERRSARKMTTPTVTEADDWNALLHGAVEEKDR